MSKWYSSRSLRECIDDDRPITGKDIIVGIVLSGALGWALVYLMSSFFYLFFLAMEGSSAVPSVSDYIRPGLFAQIGAMAGIVWALIIIAVFKIYLKYEIQLFKF